ncbi:GNAT family N-acetyltransferase [Brachybacterium huguangmaarense]
MHDFAATSVAPTSTAVLVPAADLAVRRAHLRELDAPTFYRLAALREAVFCLEQGATDADLDGRELEETTVLVWLEDPHGRPVAQARVLADPEAMRIGRVAVIAERRRGGTGRRLMAEALAVCHELAPRLPVHIDAQAHLEAWYGSMGFATVGEPFMEAGIEHVAMVRPLSA